MGIESPVFNVVAEKAEKQEVVRFENKSFEDLTAKGAERLEALKEKFGSMRDGVKDGFSRVWSRVKGVGETAVKAALVAPELVASAPEISSYALQKGRSHVESGYTSAADFVNSKMAEARFAINRSYMGVIDGVRDKLNGIENRGFDLVSGFSDRVAAINDRVKSRVEERRATVNAERREEQLRAIVVLIGKAEQLGLKVKVEGLA